MPPYGHTLSQHDSFPILHGSDSYKNAAIKIAYFFKPETIVVCFERLGRSRPPVPPAAFLSHMRLDTSLCMFSASQRNNLPERGKPDKDRKSTRLNSSH